MRPISSRAIPRNGHTLVVGVVARISGGVNQQEASLTDQEDHARQVVADLSDGPVEYRVIATTGKGERLDRPELAEVEALLRTRTLDLLICEDIGRMVRGTAASRLCGVAVDHGTRVLAPNDCIDTADDTWEEDVISACRDHVGHNAHTSRRLKQKLMNRFRKNDGATARPIVGYRVPADARTYSDWQREPAATPVFVEWFDRLGRDPNCSAVADWLNRIGFPTGPYARRPAWCGYMVRRVTANPLLKGAPGRGFKVTVKHHETGVRRPVKNPAGPVLLDLPHLAHVDPATWAAVNALLTARNKGLGRPPVDGRDPLAGVPRKRSRFPGRRARCGYCGRELLWGGNGQTRSLNCRGAREYRCWNSVAVPGGLVVAKVRELIQAELGRLDGFDDQLRALVARAAEAGRPDPGRLRADLDREAAELARKRANLLAALEQVGPDPSLTGRVAELAAEAARLADRRRALERPAPGPQTALPSVARLRELFAERFDALAADSFEFGDLLRAVVPELTVYLVRSIDGGPPLPRARAVLALDGVLPDDDRSPELGGLLRRVITLDLFVPNQREQIRAAAAELIAAGRTQREVAVALDPPATQCAVYHALRIHRQMEAAGLTEPFRFLTAPPADIPKFRRHRHERYRFEPLPGHTPFVPGR